MRKAAALVRGSICLMLLIVVIIFAPNVLTLEDRLDQSRLAAVVKKNSNQHLSCDSSGGVTAKLSCLCFHSLANTPTLCSLKASLKCLHNLSPVAYAGHFAKSRQCWVDWTVIHFSSTLFNKWGFFFFFFSSFGQDKVFYKYTAANSFFLLHLLHVLNLFPLTFWIIICL